MFPFVHPTIASLLQCHLICSEASKKGPFLDTKTLEIKGWAPDDSTTGKVPSLEAAVATLPDTQKDALTLLALECDNFVFKENGLDGSCDLTIQVMMNWGAGVNDNDSSHCLLASLLATNRLEAAIRLAAGHKTAGRSPLLKDMIQQVKEKDSSKHSMVSVLQTLLLPNPGLNLRNLLWHGFVAQIPRPWLALVLVLIVILERDYSAARSTQYSTDPVQLPQLCYPEFMPILKRGEDLLVKTNLLQSIDVSWIEETNPDSIKMTNEIDRRDLGSYTDWWKLVQHWIITKRNNPICICILLTCLLEHGLRQLWCHDNNRPEDRMARPGVFYVTLDGHGQRYKHDVLLHPYVGEETTQTKNAMMDRLGGPILALLTDLYCSPCGGPNLRASLAHGLWDSLLQEELLSMNGENSSSNDAQQNSLWDVVKVLLVLMEGIGEAVATSKQIRYIEDYRPIFSYTAATCRNLEFAMDELHLLEKSLQGNKLLAGARATVNLRLGGIQNLQIVTLQTLLQQARSLKQVIGNDKSKPWSTEDILGEHETNKVLSSLGAARTLLREVAEACAAYRVAIETNDAGASSRKRKQQLRVLAVSELAMTLYPFAALAALLLLEHDLNAIRSIGNVNPSIDRDNLCQAVKRSRMVVSTVSNFIVANTDRAIKAAKEYSQGKVVKAIIESYQPHQQNQ